MVDGWWLLHSLIGLPEGRVSRVFIMHGVQSDKRRRRLGHPTRAKPRRPDKVLRWNVQARQQRKVLTSRKNVKRKGSGRYKEKENPNSPLAHASLPNMRRFQDASKIYRLRVPPTITKMLHVPKDPLLLLRAPVRRRWRWRTFRDRLEFEFFRTWPVVRSQ